MNTSGSGIPLGGMGAGHLCLDARARFRAHLPGAPEQGWAMNNTFLAARMAPLRGAPYTRALCLPMTDPGAHSDGGPPFLEPGKFDQRLLFPTASHQLRDAAAPLRVTWTCFAPLIPFDHVASAMPAVLTGVRVANPTQSPVECSLLFSLDHLAEKSGPDTPTAWPVQVTWEEETSLHFTSRPKRGAFTQASEEEQRRIVWNGIVFGERRADENACVAPIQYCLAVKMVENATIAVTFWDPADTDGARDAWRLFHEHGALPAYARAGVANAGAVCATMTLEPGAERRVDFALTWHLAPALRHRLGLGDACARELPGAPETAAHGLKHLSYMFGAVENWQKQITRSDVPPALTRLLFAGATPLVTRTRHTPEGGFRFVPSMTDDPAPAATWDCLAALALLWFAPRFHAAAVSKQLAQISRDINGKHRIGGLANVIAETILSACADVRCMGNRARLSEWFPRICALVEWVETGRNATPEARDNTPVNQGLWAVALRAAALLARECGDTPTAERYALSARALEHRILAGATERGAANTPGAAGELIDTMLGPCLARLFHLPGFSLDTHTREKALKVAKDTTALEGYKRELVAACLPFLLPCPETTAETLFAPLHSRIPDLNTHAPADCATSVESLGAWAMLQALVGFHHDALRGSLSLSPPLVPETKMRLPVFTPTSLGTLYLKYDIAPKPTIQLRLVLNTPTILRDILLRLPEHAEQARISCLHDSDRISSDCALIRDGTGALAHIKFQRPLKMTAPLTLRIRL